jgi:hypothetical protein
LPLSITLCSCDFPQHVCFVESLARPGGNTTGFTSCEYGLSAKWVELLSALQAMRRPFYFPVILTQLCARHV